MKATLLALVVPLPLLLFGPQEPAAPPPPPEKLFAVLFRTGPAWDKAKPPNEQAFFKEHSANLAELRKAGRIVTGGRYADVGLVVVKAASLEAAKALLAGDPTIGAGVFEAQVHPWATLFEGCVSR
jgi:uncharacterized protein YciI